MRRKSPIKKWGGQKRKTKIRYLVPLIGLMLGVCTPQQVIRAASCPDLRVVFARGSGGELYNDQNYLEYKKTIETKLKTTSLNYEFIDLDYTAMEIGMNNLGATARALFGAGDAYEFGASVNDGVSKLRQMVNSAACPSTKYVVGGYSQGAMVVSKGLSKLNPGRLIYAATFGDPKIYLPEGKGIMPPACSGRDLSDYRVYVPDCQAYKGLLGAYIPYEPEALIGKVGTWCNKRDMFCSSSFNPKDHISYVADNLYEDASRIIFDKICKAFGIENRASSPHDTAILIDSTGSMGSMIDVYKAEASRLARKTLESGGRIALYDYRDLADPYTPVQHCTFETCTLERFEEELGSITTDGGGDGAESLLSASFKVMTDLEWHYGSTKSLVVLTDADFLSPDRDGMTFDEVVAMSKEIDPVNFYIITNQGDTYEALAAATDGKVATNLDELGLLTDYIMERYDSLPRVVEKDLVAPLPSLTLESVTENEQGDLVIDFQNTGDRALVAMNGYIVGVALGGTITIQGIDKEQENSIFLTPLSKGPRGEPVAVKVPGAKENVDETESETPTTPVTPSSVEKIETFTIELPKAPNTGKR